MDVARLNFSHGSHEEHQGKIDLIKKVRQKLHLPIAIMLDTKGPEYRIKTFENGKIELKDGDTFTLTTDDIVGNQERVSVNYENLIKDLKVGDRVLVANGIIILQVRELKGNNAICDVIAGGTLSDRKSMNFPNKVMKHAYLSEQDKDDLLFGIKNEVDYFDHSLIIEKGTLKEKTYEALKEEKIRIIEVDFRSTAENFSKYFYELFKKKGYQVKKVSVYETPNNCATYSEE